MKSIMVLILKLCLRSTFQLWNQWSDTKQNGVCRKQKVEMEEHVLFSISASQLRLPFYETSHLYTSFPQVHASCVF